MPRVRPPAAQVVENGEANTADDDRAHHRQQDESIGGVAHKAIDVDGEAGIVERRYGMEQTAPGGLAPAKPVRQMQAQGQQQHDRQLHHQRDDQHQFRHAADVAQPQYMGLGLRDQLGAQAERTVDQQAQQGRQGHHAEATELEQRHDHDLAEGRPVGARIDHHQTGDADRRDSGEEGREQRAGLAAGVGYG